MPRHKITHLPVSERAHLNSDQLSDLNLELGPEEAETVIYRAVEALSVRLAAAHRQSQIPDYKALRASVSGIGNIAHQIGLLSLCHVAHTVVHCIDDGDPVAVSATLARLMRLSEVSLSAVWEFQEGVT